MSNASTLVARPSSRRAASSSAAGTPARGSPPASRKGDPITVLQQFRQLFRVSQRHFQRIESRCGVSGAELWALAELARSPGLTISQAAAALSVPLSTSSALPDKLELQGLVRREPRSNDQRIVRVYITAA